MWASEPGSDPDSASTGSETQASYSALRASAGQVGLDDGPKGLSICHGLKVPPNPSVEALTPNVMAYGGGVFGSYV